MKTQHQKIIEMCQDKRWHCGNEFRALYIFSPHKRRSEIEERGIYKFEPRKCEHGYKGVLDYKMYAKNEIKKETKEDQIISPKTQIMGLNQPIMQTTLW